MRLENFSFLVSFHSFYTFEGSPQRVFSGYIFCYYGHRYGFLFFVLLQSFYIHSRLSNQYQPTSDDLLDNQLITRHSAACKNVITTTRTYNPSASNHQTQPPLQKIRSAEKYIAQSYQNSASKATIHLPRSTVILAHATLSRITIPILTPVPKRHGIIIDRSGRRDENQG